MQNCSYSQVCEVLSRGVVHIQIIYVEILIDNLFLNILTNLINFFPLFFFSSATFLGLKAEVIHMAVCILFKIVFVNTAHMCFGRVHSEHSSLLTSGSHAME